MKAEITQNKKAFEPIEVKITIESLEELEELCARLSLQINDVNYSCWCDYIVKNQELGIVELHKQLNNVFRTIKTLK